MLVRFHDVSKSFGSFDILRNVSFEIHPGEKVGLIGANGTGKTTLLGLIQNPDRTDEGSVTLGAGIRIGRLDQIPEFSQATVLEESRVPFAHLGQMEKRLREMEEAIAAEANPGTMERYSTLQHEFEFRGGYSYRARAEAALFGIGFQRHAFSQPAASLSGGEKNRLALAQLLLSESDLLLLDEPTNQLDIRSIEWLERYLAATPSAMLIVSHDRQFLDRIVGRVLELEGGTIHAYNGNYSAYVKQHDERMESHRKEWERQQEWIGKTQDYIRRNLAGQKTRQAQSRRKALERIKPLRRPPTRTRAVRFRFVPSSATRRHVINARDLAIGYPARTILENVSIDVERGQRWAFLGPNGSGKTTLLQSLIGVRAPLGGELDWEDSLEVGYYDQQLGDLVAENTVLDELRLVDSSATDGDLRGFLAQFLFSGENVFKRVDQLSGGEKSKLTLAKIIYAAPAMLALDEPTNHLDITSREALEPALASYPGTMLFISHDRRLVQSVATHILYIDGGKARTFERFESFERWLGDQIDTIQPPVEVTAADAPAGGKDGPRFQGSDRRRLSKNRRDRLESRIRDLEASIERMEQDIEAIEQLFHAPPEEMDWDQTNRRYAELKSKVNELYTDLAEEVERLEGSDR